MTLQFDFPVDTAKERTYALYALFSCGFKFFAANFALDAALYSLYFFSELVGGSQPGPHFMHDSRHMHELFLSYEFLLDVS